MAADMVTLLPSYPVCLTLHTLELFVSLGYGEAERLTLQRVKVDVMLHLSNLPQSSYDDGEGFLCYDQLSMLLLREVQGRSFALIEYLARILGDATHAWLQPEVLRAGVKTFAYTLRLHKCDAPVPALKGGASFTYTTLPQGL